ncbi:inorganic diphosphatase [Oceanirhabdus seepicola]|uniref:inorganic diphosphatase n=1 Tax=Oceanirhabdus seepicola TaxID=2828781 RepID=A0A9J6NVT5_9CLOT|nr:inorganic diphosphatase [Oceanirhabdus seepicola]MCM1988591.1 inorganic diphosphatase [Oceanirhabdus seepicola]
MIITMRVEQTQKYEKRIKYIPEGDYFIETNSGSLMYERGFDGVYGWIEGYGSPPEKHLDIYVVTQKQLSLGDRIQAKVIGCFLRNDGDNKIIAIEEERKEKDISELEYKEMSMLRGLYPRIGENEGWFGKEKAIEIMRVFRDTHFND